MFAVVRFILDDERGEKGVQVADIGWLAKQFWVLFIHHDFAEQAFLAAEIAADQRDIDARAVRDIAKADAVVAVAKEAVAGCRQYRRARRCRVAFSDGRGDRKSTRLNSSP